jgi:miniconductance mechanosensitive channel
MDNFDAIFDKWLRNWLIHVGISEDISIYVSLIINTILLFVICYIVYWITKKVVSRIVSTLIKKTKSEWDDILLKEKVFSITAHLAPIFVLRFAFPLVFSDFSSLVPMLIKGTDIYFIIVVIKIINSILNSVERILKKSPALKDKPMHSYFQLLKIILYLLGIIVVISVFIDKSPIYLISAFGAMSAVLILVFKDTILGFVASVQVSANDMVRVGDWITMEKHGADGDVLKITLNTVKIQNFDKTIVTVPTYAFISESFQNWRGMSESGGRRIKRALNIRISEIKFCTKEMLTRFKKTELVRDYINEREKEIENYNKKVKIDKSRVINGRNLTNVGVYRKYIETYYFNGKTVITN